MRFWRYFAAALGLLSGTAYAQVTHYSTGIRPCPNSAACSTLPVDQSIYNFIAQGLAFQPQLVTNAMAAITENNRTIGSRSFQAGTITHFDLGYISGVTPVTGWIMSSSMQVPMTIVAIVGTVEAAAPSGTKIDVYSTASGTACASGTKVTTTQFAADGTAHTDQSLATSGTILAGYRLCWSVSGTWTSTTGVGNITVWAYPAR